MNNGNYYLNKKQYNWLADQLPQPKAETGRLAIPNRKLLKGIIYVLKTGCRWQDIPKTICKHNFTSCWRRLSYWQKHCSIILTWQLILILLDKEQKIDLNVGNIDGSLVQSPNFKDGVGYSGKHHRNGTNISLITEKEGLPLVTNSIKGNRHDLLQAEKTVKKIKVGYKKRVKKLNGDKGFDSKTFRQFLRKKGIKSNIPERNFKNRRKKGRKPIYDKLVAKFRPFIERTFAWLKYFRRLRYRWERKKKMFQAFFDLGCLLICLRRVGVLQ